jgi:hypothetical protein
MVAFTPEETEILLRLTGLSDMDQEQSAFIVPLTGQVTALTFPAHAKRMINNREIIIGL